MNKLVYIANARLPTEKAHGYQICKMCEAFAYNDVIRLLLYPKRHQLDPALGSKSVFDYYGIAPNFEVRALPNWDIVQLSPFIPDKFLYPFLRPCSTVGIVCCHSSPRGEGRPILHA